MYVDHFKQYQAFFGEVVERMNKWENEWKQARILNMIELALMTRDFEWWVELQEELHS